MAETTANLAPARRTDAGRFRRTAVGICLIAAPLLLLVGGLLTPGSDEEPAAYVAALAANPARAELSAGVSYLGFVLLVPAVFGLLHLLRHRASVVVHVGSVLAVLGAVSFPANVSTNFYDLALARSMDRGPALAVLQDLAGMAGPTLVLLAALVGLSAGLLALGVALWRAGLAPGWVPAAILVGLAVLVLGGADPVLMSLGYLPLLAALGSVGLADLQMSSQEWEGTPITLRRVAGPPAGSTSIDAQRP